MRQYAVIGLGKFGQSVALGVDVIEAQVIGIDFDQLGVRDE